MRPFYFLLLFAGFGCSLEAQDKLSTAVTLALNNSPSNTSNTDAVFMLNSSTGEFTAVVNLFPAVPNPDVQDSLAIRDKPLQLKMRGQFPAGDISFVKYRDNIKKYTMQLSCTIYDSTRIYPVAFSLITPENEATTQVANANIYQAKLNFIMAINPQDFGLNREPFAIYYPVIMIVNNAAINKAL